METTHLVVLLLLGFWAFRLGWDRHVRWTLGTVHPVWGTVGKASGWYGVALLGAVVSLS